MKHTVFLINIPEDSTFGGCERLLLEYLAFVDYTKNRISIVTTKDVFSDRIRNLNLQVPVIQFPFKIEGSFTGQFSNMNGLFKLLKPDSVVFVMNGFLQFTLPYFLSAFFASKGNVITVEVLGAPKPPEKIRKKYLGFIPSLNLWWYKLMIPITARSWFIKKINVVSLDLKEKLIEYYKYHKSKIEVCYHGIDVNKFQPNLETRRKMRQEMNIAETDKIIIALARFDNQKRLDRLIKAYGNLSEEYPNSHLFLVGDGELREYFESMVKSRNLDSQVKFFGFKDDVISYLQMSDIYALSSDNEGFARVTMESMATGLILVATKVPGAEEAVEHGENGFLVEKSVDGVARGLKRALNLSEENRVLMAKNARKTIVDHFEIEARVKNTLDFMEIN